MAFDDAVKLAMLGREVSLESIRTGVIDPQQGMAIFDNTVLMARQPASLNL